jgi:hypothetical protein
MANALLPVPPDAQDLPPAIVQKSLEKKAATIQRLLGEETFHMVSPTIFFFICSLSLTLRRGSISRSTNSISHGGDYITRPRCQGDN